jgi:GxxExxY protein
MKDEYPQRELSAAIIGAAMKVLNGLRPGLDEKIYENSLVLELIAQGHQVEQSRMLSGSIIVVIWSAR